MDEDLSDVFQLIAEDERKRRYLKEIGDWLIEEYFELHQASWNPSCTWFSQSDWTPMLNSDWTLRLNSHIAFIVAAYSNFSSISKSPLLSPPMLFGKLAPKCLWFHWSHSSAHNSAGWLSSPSWKKDIVAQWFQHPLPYVKWFHKRFLLVRATFWVLLITIIIIVTAWTFFSHSLILQFLYLCPHLWNTILTTNEALFQKITLK